MLKFMLQDLSKIVTCIYVRWLNVSREVICINSMEIKCINTWINKSFKKHLLILANFKQKQNMLIRLCILLIGQEVPGLNII